MLRFILHVETAAVILCCTGCSWRDSPAAYGCNTTEVLSAQARLEEAEALKKEGNDLYGKGDADAAAVRMHHCCCAIDHRLALNGGRHTAVVQSCQ